VAAPARKHACRLVRFHAGLPVRQQDCPDATLSFSAWRQRPVTRFRNILLLLRGQFWIVPAIICALALMLAYWLLTSGGALVAPARDIWWLYSGDADSAREVLSSLLSGLITMTSLVVSMTFVILTLAANQLGPRVIAIFIADRQIQAVLGLFLGTILYVLLVLRTLDDELGKAAVPHIAVTVGSGLTAACLFALLLYVHKVARSIIADNVVAAVARQLRRHIAEILPERERLPEEGGAPVVLNDACSVSLERSGYIQTIDYEALVKLARDGAAVIRIEVKAGDFVLRKGAHVRVHPQAALDDSLAALRQAFVIGEERTPAQDLEHGIRQLVEIALRALSPAMNDPFTAMAVIERLGAALEDVLSRGSPPRLLKDADGVLRVVANRSDFDGLLGAAFDMISQAASEHPAVLMCIADTVGQLAAAAAHDAGGNAADALRGQLAKLAETAAMARVPPTHRPALMQRIERARAAIACRFQGRSADLDLG
jgi:uncharacterized membrane protein